MDHKNLLFTLHPLTVEPTIAEHKIRKVARRALSLNTFNCVIEHEARDSNDFPDTLAQMRRYKPSEICECRVRKATLYSGIPKSPYSAEFEWPDCKSLLTAELKTEAPNTCTKDADSNFQQSGKFWIPKQRP